MIFFGIFCATVIIIFYIFNKYRCKHEWIKKQAEYTESVMGWRKYKTITQECKKCGKTEIDKYHIN